MSSLPVFASALSKLQADIAIIRLIRAGIPADRISAVFPRGRAPNTVCCWLKHFNRIPGDRELPIAAAGQLGLLFKEGTEAPGVDHELEALGLNAELAHQLLGKTEAGDIVICVHSRNEAEAAIAWHIFFHAGIEDITGISRESYPARADRSVKTGLWAAEIAA
jgi:hypothetical protein